MPMQPEAQNRASETFAGVVYTISCITFAKQVTFEKGFFRRVQSKLTNRI